MLNADKIAVQYKIIENAYNDIMNKYDQAECFLAIIIRARQAIELLKIPTFIELIENALNNGKSCAVFVNFNETLHTIAKKFKTTCLIYGKQNINDRMHNIHKFQNNLSNIIIINIKAGSVGLSLHDLHGSHQRYSIISPTWSAQDFIQTLGRVFRAGSKTDPIQHIIYCQGTVEEKICSNVQHKLVNLSKLNDGDVDSYNVIGLTKHNSNNNNHNNNHNNDDINDDNNDDINEILIGNTIDDNNNDDKKDKKDDINYGLTSFI
jgi:superfamily II DNA or RNA helicase